jgi:uncharacterized membrane protein YkoI
MKKWFAIPALAGAVVIGGVAMVANAEKGDNPSTGVLAVEADQAKLTVEEVEAKAAESVDGTITEIDYDSSDNEYEVEVESGSVTYELDINATSGEVVKKEMDDKKSSVVKSDEKETAKTTSRNKNFITAKEAIAIALKHSPGTVKEVELDDDDKRAHFEIEIKDGKYEYEFEIDAITGEILDFEKDRDDD